VPQPAITPEIHKALDVHGNLSSEIPFNQVLAHDLAYPIDLFVAETFHLDGWLYPNVLTNQGGP
jgi:hypothetical protein